MHTTESRWQSEYTRAAERAAFWAGVVHAICWTCALAGLVAGALSLLVK